MANIHVRELTKWIIAHLNLTMFRKYYTIMEGNSKLMPQRFNYSTLLLIIYKRHLVSDCLQFLRPQIFEIKNKSDSTFSKQFQTSHRHKKIAVFEDNYHFFCLFQHPPPPLPNKIRYTVQVCNCKNIAQIVTLVWQDNFFLICHSFSELEALTEIV